MPGRDPAPLFVSVEDARRILLPCFLSRPSAPDPAAGGGKADAPPGSASAGGSDPPPACRWRRRSPSVSAVEVAADSEGEGRTADASAVALLPRKRHNTRRRTGSRQALLVGIVLFVVERGGARTGHPPSATATNQTKNALLEGDCDADALYGILTWHYGEASVIALLYISLYISPHCAGEIKPHELSTRIQTTP
jgi:hypothetical protein